MPILNDLFAGSKIIGGMLREKIDHQASRTAESSTKKAITSSERTPYRAAVYFGDQPQNLYQLRQWIPPMERLATSLPVVIVTRSARSTEFITRITDLPVVCLYQFTDLERFVERNDLGIVFYVNQGYKNFHMLSFPEPAHVHLGHGESDKISSASNQLKAYDAVFVAGEAARERIKTNLIDFDLAKVFEVGRPQSDTPSTTPGLPEDGRTVVLYAPTWEADRPGMHYGSLVSHGEGMVESLLADDRFRLIYRPHPKTGIMQREYAAANHKIARMIRRHNELHPGANHVVDQVGPLGWQLDVADVAITDISAVAFDWLATGKPMLMTIPVSRNAVVDDSGLISTQSCISVEDAPRAAELVHEVLAHDQPDRSALVFHYFGDTSAGAATARFEAAVQQIVQRRDAQRAARRAAIDAR